MHPSPKVRIRRRPGPGPFPSVGFPGAGLSFASYDEVLQGSVGPDGKRRSIFRRGASGEPVLIERLRRRIVENQRDRQLPGAAATIDPHAPLGREQRGMPLGLPALTPRQLALVEAWVKAGHPGPKR